MPTAMPVIQSGFWHDGGVLTSFGVCPAPDAKPLDEQAPPCLESGQEQGTLYVECSTLAERSGLKKFVKSVDESLKDAVENAKEARKRFEKRVCDFRYAEIEEHTLPCLIELTETFSELLSNMRHAEEMIAGVREALHGLCGESQLKLAETRQVPPDFQPETLDSDSAPPPCPKWPPSVKATAPAAPTAAPTAMPLKAQVRMDQVSTASVFSLSRETIGSSGGLAVANGPHLLLLHTLFLVVLHVGVAHERMSLFPEEAEALALADINAVRLWYGIDDQTWAAFHLQVGQPDLRIFSALPAEALTENIMRTKAGAPPASLTPAHAVQIGLVWRLAGRLSFVRGGGRYADWKDIDPWATPTASSPAAVAPPAPALKERGIKMSSVIDQSDDSEFVPESLPKADAWYQRYMQITGGSPQEEEDCTVEQLSALNKRVHNLDLPPYVDLGVWQPYGRRALRANKSRAWFPDGAGGYIARELPGPSSWAQWLAAWWVFQTEGLFLQPLFFCTCGLFFSVCYE
eukprot:s8255_g2.t1